MTLNKWFRLLSCLVMLASALPAAARQLDYSAQKIGAMQQLSYRYQGYDGQPQAVTFMVNGRALQEGAAQFQPFDRDALQNYTVEYLQHYAGQMRGVQVSVDRMGDTVGFNAIGSSDEQVQSAIEIMKKRSEEAEDNFLYPRYLVKDTTGKYIMPDHIRVASDYVRLMRPIARALLNQAPDKSPRGAVNAVLNFVQSIPYDTLQNRSTSNGSGFATPYGMIQMNKGDCDTKSVAVLSMLRALYPNMPVAMIYTSEHAFVGIDVPAASGDRILTIERKVYVLAEPAGPGLLPLGNVSNRSSEDLDRGYFSYVVMP